ncbi:hypothetical protein CEXT_367091 [Caerostris extrusa]|uniref:Uncharacterized protein n=1 Tax=Caerostris extrusa TaxID=172846 RepID=A0AAV4NH89_CAEEX|nr:hypothetical protein CEXT_367091 [Caerostris extrusa]
MWVMSYWSIRFNNIPTIEHQNHQNVGYVLLKASDSTIYQNYQKWAMSYWNTQFNNIPKILEHQIQQYKKITKRWAMSTEHAIQQYTKMWAMSYWSIRLNNIPKLTKRWAMSYWSTQFNNIPKYQKNVLLSIRFNNIPKLPKGGLCLTGARNSTIYQNHQNVGYVLLSIRFNNIPKLPKGGFLYYWNTRSNNILKSIKAELCNIRSRIQQYTDIIKMWTMH